MKHAMLLAAALLLAPGAHAEESAPTQGALEISVTNIENGSGTLYVAVYASDEYWLDADPDNKPFYETNQPVSGTGDIVIPVEELAPGKYAVSLFQDLDGDGELDTNFIGYPKEPFGFSAPMGTFGPPKFEEAAVEVSAQSSRVVVSLN